MMVKGKINPEEEIIGALPREGWISAEQLSLYLGINKETLKRHVSQEARGEARDKEGGDCRQVVD